MIDLHTPLREVMEGAFQKRIDEKENRLRAARQLFLWLSKEARKKPVPDLADRLEAMRKRTDEMVEGMKITFERGKLVVKVVGSAEDTLKMYRLGTSWFEPDPDVTEQILLGLFEQTRS
jgi:phosphoglucomutase